MAPALLHLAWEAAVKVSVLMVTCYGGVSRVCNSGAPSEDPVVSWAVEGHWLL